jgi:ADP-heptose:LPS heptosyltransferase
MIIDRKGALGDIILMTPSIREYRRRNPDEYIGIRTLYPEVFLNNPYIDECSKDLHRPNEKVINLNGEYEKNLNRHPIQAYSEAILGDSDYTSWKLDLFPTEDDRCFVDEWWQKNIKTDKKVIVLHFGITWVPLKSEVLEEVIAQLVKKYEVILVGRKISKEYYPKNMEGVIDLVDKEWSIHKLQWLIQKSEIFFGSDTGIMHIAATTNTPIACCYSFVNPEFRKPFRDKVLFIPIVSNICPTPFCAELKRIRVPNGDFGGVNCNTFNCAKDMSANNILEAIETINKDINTGILKWITK